MTMEGKRHTPEAKRLISEAKLGSLNPHWAGDAVSGDGGRLRAVRYFPLPLACQECGAEGGVERHHKDANTTNNTDANIAFLCRRCHMQADGRLDHLIAMNKIANPAKYAAAGETNRINKKAARGNACKNGHPLAAANVYTAPDGYPECKICSRAAGRRYKARKAGRVQ